MIAAKPPLHSPLSKASNQIPAVVGDKKMDGDVQFNTLPRYSKPKTYAVKSSERFPPLRRLNIRSLRPKSQSPTRSNSHHGDDKLSDIPVVSPSPSAMKPFIRGHRRGSSWIQVTMVTSVTKVLIIFTKLNWHR